MNLGYQDPAVSMPFAATVQIGELGALTQLDAWKTLNWWKQTALNREARNAGQPRPFPNTPAGPSLIVTGQPPSNISIAAMQSATATWQKRAAAANAPKPAPAAQRIVVTQTEAGPQVQTVQVRRVPAAKRSLSIGYQDPAVVGQLSGLGDAQLGSWFSHTFQQVTGTSLSSVVGPIATGAATVFGGPAAGAIVGGVLLPHGSSSGGAASFGTQNQGQQNQQSQQPAARAASPAPSSLSSPIVLGMAALAAFALLGSRR